MKKYIPYIIGVILLFSSCLFFIESSYLSFILIFGAGLLCFPEISNKINNNFISKNKIVLIVLLFIIGANLKKSEAELKEKTFWSKNSEIKDKKFQELSLDQKQTFLNQIILGDFKPFSTIAMQIEIQLEQGLKNYIKYPETIQYKNAEGWGDFASFTKNSAIVDNDKGVLIAIGEFKSENKLGMEVRSKYVIRYKILDDSFLIEDINIE